MTDRIPLRVPGAPARPRDTAVVTSPYTGEALAEVELADAEDIGKALDRQRAIFDDRKRWLPAHERVAVLRRAARLLEGRVEDFALRIAREGGKPLRDARVEAQRAVNGLEIAAEEAGRAAGAEIPMGATAASAGRLAFTTREPIGIVAAVSAFNHPLNLAVHQIAPAIAAGCPVSIKPAGVTPLSCIALVDLLTEAGLPEGWCIALPSPAAVAEHLVTSDRIGFLSFIGSAAVGWGLHRKLAPGVRAALEHGGVAPLIVDESADLDRAVPAITKGGYYHAGQVCVSVQRVFVAEVLKEELVDRLAASVEQLQTGDPVDPGTDVGPLIKTEEADRVDEWVREAADAGAKVVRGGRHLGNQCYAPTLLTDTPDSVRAMRDEVFGPVVNVVGVSDLDEAIARSNSLPWAFQAAIFTRDIDRAFRAGQELDATAVMINDHTAFRVDWMPFGGRGLSGLGLGGIPYSFEEMTRAKLLVLTLS